MLLDPSTAISPSLRPASRTAFHSGESSVRHGQAGLFAAAGAGDATGLPAATALIVGLAAAAGFSTFAAGLTSAAVAFGWLVTGFVGDAVGAGAQAATTISRTTLGVPIHCLMSLNIPDPTLSELCSCSLS